MNILARMLHIILPIHCIGCGRRGIAFCDGCIAHAPLANTSEADWIHAHFSYKDAMVRKALRALKYKYRMPIGLVLAGALYGDVLEFVSEARELYPDRQFMIMGIPSSRESQKERGFNQSEVIAKEIVRLFEDSAVVFVPNVLEKIKSTERQARIEKRSDRLKNLVGAYRVRKPDIISGAHVIVIDDITTTGATFKEARRALKAAGAKTVTAFAVAH